MNKKNKKLGSILVVGSSLFYASYGIRTTLMGDFFGGYTASAIRSILVVAILLPFAWYFKYLEKLNFRKYLRTFLRMIVASTFVWGPFYFAILDIGVGLSLAVNYSMLAIGFLFFGRVLAGEVLTKTKLISASIGVVGLFLVFFPSFSGTVSILGLIAACVSGFASGATMVLAKELPYNSIQSSVILWTVSIIANIPLAFFLKEPSPLLGMHIEWIYLLLFAVASVFSSSLVLLGMKHIDAGSAGILGLLEIVFGVLFGIFLFNETLEPIAFVGIIFILGASAYPYLTSD